MNKPIHLHIAFSSTSSDRSLSINGDSYVSLTGDSDMKELKEYARKQIEAQFPDKEWGEPVFLAITELRDELYFRLFPENKPKTEMPAGDWEMSKEDGDRDLLDTIIPLGISTRLFNIIKESWGLGEYEIKTVRNLVTKRKRDFQKYRQVGAHTLHEMESIMKTLGWHWEMKVEE